MPFSAASGAANSYNRSWRGKRDTRPTTAACCIGCAGCLLIIAAATACGAADVEPYTPPSLTWFDTWFARHYARQRRTGSCSRTASASGAFQVIFAVDIQPIPAAHLAIKQSAVAWPGPRPLVTAGRQHATSTCLAPEPSGASSLPASNARRRTNSGCDPRLEPSRCEPCGMHGWFRIIITSDHLQQRQEASVVLRTHKSFSTLYQ